MKQLVCESPAKNESERLRSIAEEYRDPQNISYSIKTAKEFEKKAEQCVGADYGWKVIFVFDTSGLYNSFFANTEVSFKYLCGHAGGGVVRGVLESTPSIITFKFEKGSSLVRFNIDRKTLIGGFDTERDFTCKLYEVDTSKKKLL